jgi:hypothetical protein
MRSNVDYYFFCLDNLYQTPCRVNKHLSFTSSRQFLPVLSDSLVLFAMTVNYMTAFTSILSWTFSFSISVCFKMEKSDAYIYMNMALTYTCTSTVGFNCGNVCFYSVFFVFFYLVGCSLVNIFWQQTHFYDTMW